MTPEPPTPLASIIVPTWREAANLDALSNRIHAALTEAQAAYELLIVDDDSRDGTEEVVARLAAAGRPIRLLTRTAERGLGSAVLHGFHAAKGEVLVCMDADLSHPPEKLPEMLGAAASADTDMVLGSRYVRGGSTADTWGVGRWLNSYVATILARPFTRVRDPMSGFFAMRADRFRAATDLCPIGYKICLELIVKCRCQRVVEVPIHFSNRAAGKSKLDFRVRWQYFLHIWHLLRYTRPLVASAIAVLTAGAAISAIAGLVWLAGHARQ